MKAGVLRGRLWIALLAVVVAGAAGLLVQAATINLSPGDDIQAAIGAASGGDTIVLSAGVYNVAQTLVVNKALTISSAGATLQGTTASALCVLEVAASNVTISGLGITWATLLESAPAAAELTDSLVRIPANLNLSGVVIIGNTIYLPAQNGAMSTWVARALTIGGNGCTDVTIADNTVYNTRNGIVVQYNNTVALTDNTIYSTKGGIMNYTNTLADAANRTMSGNSWGTAHNEWDIVWNSANYDPNYHESVIELSASNEGAYVVDRRDAPGGNALGNRSHIFVSPTGTTTVNEVNGNMNTPYSTLPNGLNAVAASGTVFVAAGNYQGAVIAKQVHIDGDDAGGTVITSGVGYSPTNSTYKTAFRLDSGADGTVIDDVTVLCTPATLYYFAVFSRNVDNVAVEDLVVYDTVQGISNWGGDGWQILGNEIIGTVAAGGGGIGFYLGVRPGTNLTCSSNLLQGNVVGSDATAPDYSCPGIVLALDLRYGAYGLLTGNEELSGNRILGNTISDGGVVNGVGIEMGVIMTGIADALVPGLIHDTLGMIHGNTIAGNTVSGEYLGVYLYTVADTDVNLNVISDCTGAGIAMYDGNVDNVFRYNSISGNAYGLWNETGSLVDAALNWWGTPTGPSDQGPGLGDAVSSDVVYSPWLALDPDGDPSAPGVQVTAPMLIVVAPVGPEPTGGYLNAAIVGSNSAELPYADTIYVEHGAYDGSEPITQPVTLVSEPGSASHTTVTGAMNIGSGSVTIGLPMQGLRINGNITIASLVDAASVHINWCDLYGTATNSGDGTLDAQYNFWGTQEEVVIDARTIGDIDYAPYLPKNADDSYSDITALVDAGLAGSLNGAIDQLWTLSRMGQDVGTYIEYQGVAGAGALHTDAPNGAVLASLLPGGGGGAVSQTGVEGGYVVGETILGHVEVLDPATGLPVTDTIVTISVLNSESGVVYWGVATYDESSGGYVFEVNTSGLAPGTYELIIQTDDGETKTLSVVVAEA